MQCIVRDIAAGRYSDLHLAAFVSACAGGRLGYEELVALTRTMVAAGERLNWARRPIVDKHSVGGLPGNRTSPIVVAIVAACGLTIPKTSSRAITSPAGTADVCVGGCAGRTFLADIGRHGSAQPEGCYRCR
jgi:thymidine phosphorylase